MSADAFIGISGYDYAGWRGSFYPPDVPRRAWLAFASRVFNSIELNGTFYRTPSVWTRSCACCRDPRPTPRRSPANTIIVSSAGRSWRRRNVCHTATHSRSATRRISTTSSTPSGKLRAWTSARPSRDVYVYFDNDAKVHAPHNAMQLADLVARRK